MLFTVCTATFNRAHTLHRVFDSLTVQTIQDFEWLVIDDGSSDNTQALILKWQSEATFPIRYERQQNQGKHIAINLGAQIAMGELFLVADSDDAFPADTLEIFSNAWLAIPDATRHEFVGVTGLCVTENGTVIGDRFPQDVFDSTALDISYRHRIGGEKWGFHRTDVIRQFPSPSIKGLPFYGEGIIWHKISRKFKTRFINKPVRVYQQNAGNQLTRRSPQDTAPAGIFYITSLNDDQDYLFVAPLKFARIATHGVRFSLHMSDSLRTQLSRLTSFRLKILWIIAGIPGVALYGLDLLSARRRNHSE